MVSLATSSIQATPVLDAVPARNQAVRRRKPRPDKTVNQLLEWMFILLKAVMETSTDPTVMNFIVSEVLHSMSKSWRLKAEARTHSQASRVRNEIHKHLRGLGVRVPNRPTFMKDCESSAKALTNVVNRYTSEKVDIVLASLCE